ncbi:MAG TPA: hypothetical protein VM165_09160 [Planctomycetaceae bacterium]|nr:hypothetical protein [Planctomycetaceae bacterium]
MRKILHGAAPEGRQKLVARRMSVAPSGLRLWMDAIPPAHAGGYGLSPRSGLKPRRYEWTSAFSLDLTDVVFGV